ncbi:LIC10486 family protein [Leptospira idonii]|uniref:Uncharacterized protein n=1 Tax=Leptospira idonii TaxID=1193500 RepID=A0A4R9M4K0_9LEPT|nr:hypothetical protein [Leptospira idonii]TGN20901.1 hypothetical protein EHS15_01560 [Leptospira idonii]
MSDIDSKTEQLKKQADLLGLTMEAVFTDEQAKEVLQGKITDAYLVKIKIDIENKNGMLLILVSSIRKQIMEIYAVVGNSPIFRRIRTFADYLQISQDLADVGKTGGVDLPLSENLGRTLHRVFTKEKLEEFLPLWQKKDPSRISELLETPFFTATRAKGIKLQAEIDKLSSAKFRYENPMKGYISPIMKPADETETPAPDLNIAPTNLARGEANPLDRQIGIFRQGRSKEFSMKTVISPISGVEFDNLIEGQEILFRVPLDTAEGMANAGLLGLIDAAGNVSKEPVVGKFLGIASSKNEFHIFAEGPNQYLFHSIEEHPVKVAIPKGATVPTAGDKQAAAKKKGGVVEQKKGGGGNLVALMGAFVAIVLVGVLIFVMFIL